MPSDKTKSRLSVKLARMVVKRLESMEVECPDCTAEQLAVDIQTVIADAAAETANDEASILGELQLILDDCQNPA